MKDVTGMRVLHTRMHIFDLAFSTASLTILVSILTEEFDTFLLLSHEPQERLLPEAHPQRQGAPQAGRSQDLPGDVRLHEDPQDSESGNLGHARQSRQELKALRLQLLLVEELPDARQLEGEEERDAG